MEKIIIVAVAENNVIGKDGKIPWHSKEEFKHFKNTTMGAPIIMGRKTFESIGTPLKGRLNIVVTRQTDYNAGCPDVVIVKSLEKAYEHCSQFNHEKVFVIGGEQIYSEAFKDVDKIILTKMKIKTGGDSFFPEVKLSEWNIDRVEEHEEFSVYFYSRKFI